MELVRSSLSIPSGLPCEKVRSAPAIVFSGPAQRSLSLWPARSPSRLATLYIESSDSFVASAAVSIVTGWNEPVPGRELHPLKSSAFHGALFRELRFVCLNRAVGTDRRIAAELSQRIRFQQASPSTVTVEERLTSSGTEIFP